MKTRAAVLFLLPAASLSAAPRPVETIRYETGPCYGRCPAYVVTLASDGQGWWQGRSDTAVRGRRRFRVTPAQFTAFADRLRPVRPNGEVLIEPGQPLCRSVSTDQITVDVRWTGGTGDPRHLGFYFGCDMDSHADLKHALIAAPMILPIAALIGR